MTTVQRMTFNDLMAQPDDDYLYELVRGEILRMPPPKEDHGCVEAALVEAIGRYLDDRALALGWEKSQGRAARNRLVGRLLSGDVGVRFSLPDDPDQLRGLDVCYLSAEQVARLGAVPTAEYLVEMPALVAEVISPSETASYINEKVNDLLRGGAQLVWLFYPKTRTVMVLRPDGSARMIPAGGLLDGNDVLPGFMVELASIFA
ncbi:MAG TPA: Uma2 family endonuclease [Chloroflexota bacterium]|nr:Uma2 family endonuclease [Chloroflexota bacterium]